MDRHSRLACRSLSQFAASMAGVSLWLLAAALAGCSIAARNPHNGSAENAESERGAILTRSDRVLVLPFRDGSDLPVYGSHVMCPLTGEHLDAGEVPSDAGVGLGSILFQQLSARGISLVPYDPSRQRASENDRAWRDKYEPSVAVQLGKQTNANKVIVGVLSCYEELSGSWLGSRQPAAVAFSLALIDVPSGTVTHKSVFNLRQAPLTSNVLALPLWWRQGFFWWTRQQVAEEALAEAADALVSSADAQTPWTNMPTHPATWELGERQARPTAMY